MSHKKLNKNDGKLIGEIWRHHRHTSHSYRHTREKTLQPSDSPLARSLNIFHRVWEGALSRTPVHLLSMNLLRETSRGNSSARPAPRPPGYYRSFTATEPAASPSEMETHVRQTQQLFQPWSSLNEELLLRLAAWSLSDMENYLRSYLGVEVSSFAYFSAKRQNL